METEIITAKDNSLVPKKNSDDSNEEYLAKQKSALNFWTLEARPRKSFITGSKYKGFWNVLGMHSAGKYNFFYGPRNEGAYFDNMCHGPGSIIYPNNGKMEGIWEKAHMISHRYYFADDLCFGPYCEMPDRRFILERRYGLKPAGRSLEINSFKPCEIPAGCYDTGDGFYDPDKRYVFKRKDPKSIIRIPTASEHDWILKYCRKAWVEPVGYRPDLYENWQEATEREISEDDAREIFKKPVARFEENITKVNSETSSTIEYSYTYT